MRFLILVNALTFLRVVFSLLFALGIKDDLILPYLLLLFLLICATDLLDGKLARHYGAQTKFGAAFDIGADIFFVMISYWVLIDAGILPLWILIIAIVKFSEFLLTSFLAVKIKKTVNQPFLFDKLGKTAAILLYILPVVSIISSSLPRFPAEGIIIFIYFYRYLNGHHLISSKDMVYNKTIIKNKQRECLLFVFYNSRLLLQMGRGEVDIFCFNPFSYRDRKTFLYKKLLKNVWAGLPAICRQYYIFRHEQGNPRSFRRR